MLLSLHATAKEIGDRLFSLEHTCEPINHGWYHSLKDEFKLTVLFRITVNFTNQVIEDRDDQLLLLWSLKFIELGRINHQLRNDWGDIFLLKPITQVFSFDVFNHSDDTLRINFTTEFFQDHFHFYNVSID